ncbi:MAG: hypothetical protein FWD80_04315 [Propionibacteriaceae bacterium]|nr:hypothetical protein [Propionibacteriaceae bacterium]
MSYDFYLISPTDPPDVKTYECVKSFFLPFIKFDNGSEKNSVWLVWPQEAPEGWLQTHSPYDMSYLELDTTITGWRSNDGCLLIDEPYGDIIWDLVFRAAQATGWLMADSLGHFFAINAEQVHKWRELRQARTSNVTVVGSAAALQTYQGAPPVRAVR